MRLPVSRIDSLPPSEPQKWLIEDLWLERACGLIGGQPKCCKTWIGLEMMLSVASGAPCLGTFKVPSPGPVLLYLAEDNPSQAQKRLSGLAAQKNISLSGLPIYIILAPTLQLDTSQDKENLAEAIQKLKPRAVLLDPLVRLHTLDENSSRDMATLLAFFRKLERSSETAILLTHHMTKRSSSRPGQALRGSGDLHAFGDSNLYLVRSKDQISCTVEHRNAKQPPDFTFRLQEGESPGLEIMESGKKSETRLTELSERVLDALSQKPAGLSRSELRSQLSINNQKLGIVLRQLCSSKRLAWNQGLYTVAVKEASHSEG